MTIAIGGLIKTTLVDFPSRVACSVFLQGCNFRCGFCHNPGMVPPGRPADSVDPEEVLRLLARRQGLVDGLCLSGGEPLMQNGLSSFLRRVKEETAVAVKLDTNGSFPARLDRLLDEGLVDFVALDIKAPPRLYGEATGGWGKPECVEESVGVLRTRQADFELRTTLVPGLAGEQQLLEICRWLGGLGTTGTTYVLQQYRPAVTLETAFASLEPFAPVEVERLATLCEPYFDRVLIRGC
jgi:pyruvate formate lyase activating enzyme